MLLWLAQVQAQLPVFSVSADKDSILIGQHIRTFITVTAPESFMNTYNWVSLPDTVNHFEVISRGDVTKTNRDGMVEARQEVVITSFDSGRWVLPQINKNGIVVQAGKTIAVHTVPVSPIDEYRDIKDIEEIKKPFDIRPWLVGGAIVLTAALLVWLAIVLARKKTNAPKPATPLLPPVSEALNELEQLLRSQWPETGKHKQFHDKLDDVFRRFLHRQYHTASVYETNEEVLLQLKQNNMAGGYTTEMAQALRLNSFVKFA
ncbi:MAG: hypothetical protein JNM68_11955, partial [Dinghuibacter sp.]|nr:hypothetical protein [Dinghuibacter sp.]